MTVHDGLDCIVEAMQRVTVFGDLTVGPDSEAYTVSLVMAILFCSCRL